MTDSPIRVTVWNEFIHEQNQAAVAAIYPDGIHQTLARGLRDLLGSAAVIQTATLQEPEHGLSAERLERTDVLLWWGHAAHDRVGDQVVDRVQQAVLAGMGSSFGTRFEDLPPTVGDRMHAPLA